MNKRIRIFGLVVSGLLFFILVYGFVQFRYLAEENIKVRSQLIKLTQQNIELQNSDDKLLFLDLPPKIYGVVGDEVNIYFDNIIAQNADDYLFDVDCSVGMQVQKRWTAVPEAVGEFPITVTVYNKNFGFINSIDSLFIVRQKPEAIAKQYNLLFIGDSLTNSGSFTEEIYKYWNGGVNLIGTSGIGDNLREGFSGKTLEWLYIDDKSPFVFDGRFNFERYTQKNNFDTVDAVFLNFGINDVFKLANITEVKTLCNKNFEMLRSIIEDIHNFDSSIKVCIATVPMPSKSQDAFGVDYACQKTVWEYKRDVVKYNNSLMQEFKSETNNVYIVPQHLNIDSENNMQVISVPTNSRNEQLIDMQNNGVHPSNRGYLQISDAICYFIVNTIYD